MKRTMTLTLWITLCLAPTLISCNRTLPEIASKIVFKNNPLSQKSTGCGSINLESEDADGKAANVNNEHFIKLTASGRAGTFYADESCMYRPIDGVVLAVNSDSVGAYFRDGAAGSVTVNAQDTFTNPLTTAEQVEIITSGCAANSNCAK